MRSRILAMVLLALLVLLIPSCTKLDRGSSTAEAVPAETLPGATTVPASWGHLVSVSSAAQYPDLVQLWFEDAEGNVRMAVFNLTSNELAHARRIGRQ